VLKRSLHLLLCKQRNFKGRRRERWTERDRCYDFVCPYKR